MQATLSDANKPSRLQELREKLQKEANSLDEFVNTGQSTKMTHTEALELRETVVPGKQVKTTKL